MIDEEKLEKLRGMTAQELSDEYKLPIVTAHNLVFSLKPENYRVLTNNELTSYQMAEKLERRVSSIFVYRGALTKTGLADKKDMKKNRQVNRGICEQARKFLDENPSTITEVIDAVNNFYPSYFHYDKKVGSIGPRGHKVYYLKGQEELAKETLEKNLKACSKEEKILNALTKPMTHGKLRKIAGLKNLENKDIRNLEFEGKLMSFRSFVKNPGTKKFGGYDLFGDIQNKTYVFKPEQVEDAAKLMIENFPPKEKIDMPMRRALSNNLKGLPKLLFEIVHAYYTPNSVDPLKIGNAKVKPSTTVTYEVINELKKVVKDFQLDINSQEDLENDMKLLRGLGLLDNDAYEIKRIKGCEIIKWNAPNLKNKNFADRDLISVVDCREENLENVEKRVQSFLKHSK